MTGLPTDLTSTAALQDALAEAQSLASSHQWVILIAFCVSVAVWAVRRFNLLAFVPAKAVPWVAQGVAALAVIANDIGTHKPWAATVLDGVLAGAGASGLWELLLQHVDAIMPKGPINASGAGKLTLVDKQDKAGGPPNDG